MKIKASDIAHAEKIIKLAEEANSVGVCFGMTAKTTRIFKALLEVAKEAKEVR